MAKRPAKKTHAKSARGAKRTKHSRASSQDIVKLILEDHKPLKRLIKILKNSEKGLAERRRAYDEFAPMLLAHAKPEARVLYTFMKERSKLRTEGFEGDIEHKLAEQLVDEIRLTKDEDMWSAKVKVLAELVEHHVKEEEEELLPDFKKCAEAEERSEMGTRYAELKEQFDSSGSSRSTRIQEAHVH
jgi:hemerythrin superfamily protein